METNTYYKFVHSGKETPDWIKTELSNLLHETFGSINEVRSYLNSKIDFDERYKHSNIKLIKIEEQITEIEDISETINNSKTVLNLQFFRHTGVGEFRKIILSQKLIKTIFKRRSEVNWDNVDYISIKFDDEDCDGLQDMQIILSQDHFFFETESGNHEFSNELDYKTLYTIERTGK